MEAEAELSNPSALRAVSDVVQDRRSWYRRRLAVSVGAIINAACRHVESSSGGVSLAKRPPASSR